MASNRSKHIETLAVHAGQPVDPATGAIANPLYLSTTYERDADGEYPRGFSYSRDDNPNRAALESCVAALEGGSQALAFPSGIAVAAAVLQALHPGDHVVAPDDVYHGFRKAVSGVFDHTALETTYVDMSDPAAVKAALRKNTKLIWMETPSNPLLMITNLAAIVEIARKAGITTVCDGTFATPVLQRPLEFGVDMVAHSTTKYLSGHSDVVGGVLITQKANAIFDHAKRSQRLGGAVPSPFDCWLTLRGIATLPCRVRAQSTSAFAIAEFLDQHAKVERVFYPGLTGHPGNDIAQDQMSMFGGVLSFLVKGTAAEAMRVAAATEIFLRATSLGGTHSLIEHRASVEGPDTRTPQNLLRLSIGLENTEDLIADLRAALARA
jgi:cystathionine gamma-synthase